jgi:hypothetical protein
MPSADNSFDLNDWLQQLAVMEDSFPRQHVRHLRTDRGATSSAPRLVPRLRSTASLVLLFQFAPDAINAEQCEEHE